MSMLLALACSELPKAAADGAATKLQRAAGAAKGVPKADAGSFTPRSALPPRAGSRPEPHVSVDWTKPEDAMREFLAAVWFRDPKRLLACFSRKGSWSWFDTSNKRRAGPYKYSELASSMRPEDNWYGAIFGDGEPDLRDIIEDTHNLRWVENETLMFSPWDTAPYAWVRWRREGDRYVVDEIALN